MLEARRELRSVCDARASDYSENVQQSSLSEQAALVTLLNARPDGLTVSEITLRVREAESAVTVLEQLAPEQLFDTGEFDTAGARAQVEEWASQGLQFLTILDDRYPAPLRDIHQAPAFLFARGELRRQDPAVSVVGSRAASPQGLKMAASVAIGLVERGISVVAGLASGIDTQAHVSALAAGGRTVAVIATGIRVQYPASNRELHERIATEGLLLSQYWPDAHPQKYTFLMRNATMSGYGMATVVIEAGEHSGARAQARLAVEHGRPVVLSDLVVERTEWGKQMVGRPGVSVASSTDEVLRLVDRQREVDDQVQEAVRDLLAL